MGTDILSRIVDSTATIVATARRRVGDAEIRRRAADGPAVRSFYEALAGGGPPAARIIAEIKRRSPSKGVIREPVDVAARARAYAAGGAVALSVLTDGPFFNGSLEDMVAAREAVGIPVLRKDFTIDPYQVYEARAHGADAVLLIVRILSEEQLTELLGVAAETGMDALVEVHDGADLDIALAAGARLIGINNRNLASFDTDIGVAMEMVRRIPDDRIVVALSGIAGAADIRTNVAAGIHRFLIGETLMRAGDPAPLLSELIAAGEES